MKVTIVIFLFLLPYVLSASSSVSSAPRNVTATSYSHYSVLLQWKPPRKKSIRVTSYKIEYGFIKRKSIKQVIISRNTLNYTLKPLKAHSVYRFRIAAQNLDKVGNFSEWVNAGVDVQTFLIKVQLPSETKTEFEKALYEVLPLSYLASKFINSTKIDLSTSLIQIYYEISFEAGVNLTSELIKPMFSRDQARLVTSFVRNVDVYDISYCSTNRDNCHKQAECKDMFGSYKCQCHEGMIDLGVKGYKFPGRNCVNNTGKPTELTLIVINPNKVKVIFGTPAQKVGGLTGYELEWKTETGAFTSNQLEFLDKTGFFEETIVEDLMTNGLHAFRVRALTTVTAGVWTEWTKIRTMSNLYRLKFDIHLKQNKTDYQAIRSSVESNATIAVKEALKTADVLSMTDFQMYRSDHTEAGLIRFQGNLYLTYRTGSSKPTLSRLKNIIKKRMYTKKYFTTKVGEIQVGSVQVEDLNECSTNQADCLGNQCSNEQGTFRCKCPLGNVDTSSSFGYLPGRKCMVFDSPPSFSVALDNPKTARLTWKIPPQMRQPRLKFWFVVEHRRKGNTTTTETEVLMNEEDFTGETYVVTTTVKSLKMNADYEFRVAATNRKGTGRYTPWKKITTSNSIFVAKLNLTLVVYTRDFRRENRGVTADAAQNVRNLITRLLLPRMPHYMATGKIRFTPGIKDRTYAYAHLFFDSKSNVEPKQIEDLFKHNSFPDTTLGLDFDKVQVTDFNECDSTWDDCSPHALCENKSPGFTCICKEDYIDLSAEKKLPPGRFCLHEDLITTPQPTTIEETTAASTTPTAPPPFPTVEIAANAVTPTTLQLTWHRSTPPGNGRDEKDLDYLFHYRIKGFKMWQKARAAAYLEYLKITGLRKSLLYQIRVAEKWKEETKPHTSYSFPIEVRMEPKAFRIYLKLPLVSPLTISTPSPEKEKLTEVISDFITGVFTHNLVVANLPKLNFGSVGKMSFSAHPDRGTVASAIFYLSRSSEATLKSLNSAYVQGEGKTGKQWPIDLMFIEDLNECDSDKLNDCYSHYLCQNSEGSFRCACPSGFVDGGISHDLLPGRYCVIPNSSPSSSFTSSSSPLNTVSSSSTNLLRFSTTSKSFSFQPTLATTTKLISFNPVGFISKGCPKGQHKKTKTDKYCVDVLKYLGSINILKISGNNISSSNIVGDGKVHIIETTKAALDHAFKFNHNFIETIVQDLNVLTKKVKATFVVILEDHQTLNRFRRQAAFIPMQQISPSSIKNSLVRYLDRQDPSGQVQPLGGATVTFSPYGISIEDIDECAFNLNLHDCPGNAQCKNTIGSFNCECNPHLNDLSANNVTNRRGRRCQDQCSPNPCFNGAECLSKKEVGLPMCICTDGFTGVMCEETKLPTSDNRLLTVALAAVAGVILVFLICFFITCYINKRNKRREKNRMQEEELEENQDAGVNRSYDTSEFTSESEEEQQCEEDTKNVNENLSEKKRKKLPETPPSPIPWALSPAPSVQDEGIPPPVRPPRTAVPSPVLKTNPSSKPQSIYSFVMKPPKATTQVPFKKTKKRSNNKIKSSKTKTKKIVGGKIRKHSIDSIEQWNSRKLSSSTESSESPATTNETKDASKKSRKHKRNRS